MDSRIFVLRPFWEPSITAQHLRAIHRSLRKFGEIVVLQNGAERKHLNLADESWEPEYLSRFFGEFIHGARSLKGLQLLESTDDCWERDLLDQLKTADVVILHLGPRTRDFDDSSRGVRATPSVAKLSHVPYSTPLYDTGVGPGVLFELGLCRRLNLLNRTIIVIPKHFFEHIEQSLDMINQSERTASELDRNLAVLDNVPRIFTYRRFGGWDFQARLRFLVSNVLTTG